MKKIIALLLIVGICFLYSCLKDNGNPAPSRLTGNWILVNDSTYSGVCGLCAIVTQARSNYVGQPGDGFNFSSTGILYIKEGANRDTAAYNINQDTLKLSEDYKNLDDASGLKIIYIISNFTAHTLKLTGGSGYAPGIVYTHVIYLKK